MLKSRKIYTRESFVEEFVSTFRAGIIKRRDFINWSEIEKNIVKFEDEIDFFEELVIQENKLIYLKDSLLAADEPLKFIRFIFNILGHTPDDFVSWEDYINIKKLSSDFQNDVEPSVNYFINFLKEINFEGVLNKKRIREIYFGVLIGLETHKRKNVGGNSYVDYIEPILNDIVRSIKNYNLELKKEVVIEYGGDSKQSKKVDFAIYNKSKLVFGIEVNFYTNTGSKPTEIKRSYGIVNQELNKLNIQLIWITDGFGYTKMKKSLGDAFEIHKNTYNSNMVLKDLKNDIISYLNKND